MFLILKHLLNLWSYIHISRALICNVLFLLIVINIDQTIHSKELTQKRWRFQDRDIVYMGREMGPVCLNLEDKQQLQQQNKPIIQIISKKNSVKLTKHDHWK